MLSCAELLTMMKAEEEKAGYGLCFESFSSDLQKALRGSLGRSVTNQGTNAIKRHLEKKIPPKLKLPESQQALQIVMIAQRRKSTCVVVGDLARADQQAVFEANPLINSGTLVAEALDILRQQ